jgi:hypothetical protein
VREWHASVIFSSLPLVVHANLGTKIQTFHNYNSLHYQLPPIRIITRNHSNIKNLSYSKSHFISVTLYAQPTSKTSNFFFKNFNLTMSTPTKTSPLKDSTTVTPSKFARSKSQETSTAMIVLASPPAVVHASELEGRTTRSKSTIKNEKIAKSPAVSKKSSKSKPKKKLGESTATIGLSMSDLYHSENPFKSRDVATDVGASGHDTKGNNAIPSDSVVDETKVVEKSVELEDLVILGNLKP